MPARDRMRSLADINEIFRAAMTVEHAIADMVETRSPLDVLEVGFGYGRVLMELACSFRGRNVTFHGIDVTRHTRAADMHCYLTCGACPTRRADRDDLALTGADQRECDARSCR